MSDHSRPRITDGLASAEQSSVRLLESLGGTRLLIGELMNCRYGVSRVYSQQCGYVLADAQSAQHNMRSMLRVVSRPTELDPEAGRARCVASAALKACAIG